MTPFETPTIYEHAALHGLYQGAVIGLFILVIGAFLAAIITWGIEAVDDRMKRLKTPRE